MGPIDVHARFPFIATLLVAGLAACGGTPRGPGSTTPDPSRPIAQGSGSSTVESPPLDPPRKLLDIDWASVNLTSDAEALALWSRIAPTGADWADKLDEVPEDLTRSLGIALLRAGNFQCVPVTPARDCSVLLTEVPEPQPTAGLPDPCLRRLLALWALEQLEPEDIPSVMDGLRAIAGLAAPESQLVTAAVHAVPEIDQARRLELIAIAYRAGQRDVANGLLGSLDEKYLLEAVAKHHIDGALEILSAEGHRATYLAAITDEDLLPQARQHAITELTATGDPPAADLRAALVAATRAKDCGVAAAAIHALEAHGETAFRPKPARTTEGMMRALCLVASYELRQRNDQASLLPAFVPATGLERIDIAYDALGEVDEDGDGDPHTIRTAHRVPRTELVMPEVQDVVRAMQRCKGTVCTSHDREVRFSFKQAGAALVLYRLELVERPSCPTTP